jgi:hypothetical protein
MRYEEIFENYLNKFDGIAHSALEDMHRKEMKVSLLEII